MTEYHSHDLPLEIYEDQLRYLWPETFIPTAEDMGWAVAIEENTDNNHYKVLYVMSRPVSEDFDDAVVVDMRKQIGIVNENDEIIDDYDLWVWPVVEDRETDPLMSEARWLIFEFEGFPTDQTMDVIEKLMGSFPDEPKPGRWARLLGYFGLRTANSDQIF